MKLNAMYYGLRVNLTPRINLPETRRRADVKANPKGRIDCVVGCFSTLKLRKGKKSAD